MTALVWDKPGERIYETGVDRGVLYPGGGTGVAWNGLVSVTENVSGGDSDAFYYDGVKYLDWIENEDFQATLEAFSAPYEFGPCDGTKAIATGLFVTQQPRTTFGLSYRTRIGNDLAGTDFAYKLHIVYNATASPFGRATKTLDDGNDLNTMSWTINTVPPASATYKPTAHFIVDSRSVDSDIMDALEGELYGTVHDVPTLLLPADLINLLS